MKNILFVESELKGDNENSTCYKLKCDKICENMEYYNILNDFNLDTSKYDTVLFGCRSLYLYKKYKGEVKKKLKDNFEKLMDIKNKYFLIQDMHKKTYGSLEKLCDLLNSNNINIIFTFFNNAEARYIRKLTPNCKHLYIPHHIDTNIFKIYETDKIYDILLFGAVHPMHYPFRHRLFDLILNNQDKFNVFHISHNQDFNPEFCEIGLSKYINKSKICIATKSKYDYYVGKYLEISSSNSLIAGDIPTDGKDILKGNIIELNQNMTDTEIIDILTNALDNYDSYNKNVNYLKNLIDNEYNLDKYVEKLIALITDKNM